MMHIGGSLYHRLLHLIAEVETSLINQGQEVEVSQELIDSSRPFCRNHGVSFDFLLSPDLSAVEKVTRLRKLANLVAKLQAAEEARSAAHDKMNRYR